MVELTFKDVDEFGLFQGSTVDVLHDKVSWRITLGQIEL